MAYLKQDVNRFFAILVLILLIVAVGSFLFFQNRIQNLTTTKQNHTQELNKMTAYIVEEGALKESLEGNLNKSLRDRQALEEQLYIIESEKDVLRRSLLEKEAQLQNTSFYYEQTRLQLADAETKKELLTKRNAEMEQSLEDAIKQVSSLASEKRKFCQNREIETFCE